MLDVLFLRRSVIVIVIRCRYIDDAVVQLLKSAEVHYGEAHDNPTLYKCQVFKQNRLIDIAGIVKHEHFFTQPLSRRTVAYMWGLVCSKTVLQYVTSTC